jgi:hypothetical protein
MDYGEAAKRVRRIAAAPGHPLAKRNLISSIINQATIREGKRANVSLQRVAQESSFLSGSGTRQSGYGPGKKWTEAEFIANGFKEVRPGVWSKVI